MVRQTSTASDNSRSGHWRWRTGQEARVGVQCSHARGRLPRRRGASAAAENGAGQGIRCRDRSRFAGVQALGGVGAGGESAGSDLRVLLRVQRRDRHLLEGAVVSALVVTHHDLRLGFAARGHVGAGRRGGVHRQRQAFHGGGFKGPGVPRRVGGVGFSAGAAVASAGFLRFGQVHGVEAGQVLVRVEPLPASGGGARAPRGRRVPGRVYGFELVAELGGQGRELVRAGEVLWRGRKVTLDVVASGVIVRIDGVGIGRVQGGLLVDYLVIGEFLDVRQRNAGHPIRRIPVIPLLEKKTRCQSVFLPSVCPAAKGPVYAARTGAKASVPRTEGHHRGKPRSLL